MKNDLRKGGVAVLLSVLFGILFSGAVPAQEPVPIAEDGVQRVEVLGGSYFFRPAVITVRKNVPVELVVKVEPGLIPHDIAIHEPEAGIDFTQSLSTDPVSIRFTPTKTGNFPFYCTKKLLFFASHRDHGMEGMLVVVD